MRLRHPPSLQKKRLLVSERCVPLHVKRMRSRGSEAVQILCARSLTCTCSRLVPWAGWICRVQCGGRSRVDGGPNGDVWRHDDGGPYSLLAVHAARCRLNGGIGRTVHTDFMKAIGASHRVFELMTLVLEASG